MRIFIFSLVCCFTLTNCGTSKYKNKMVEINGKVIEFIPNALHDSFEDGAFQTFDAVRLSIEKPADLKSKQLLIYLPKNPDKTAIWKQTGGRVAFRIEDVLLEGDDALFVDALEDIHLD